MYIEKLFLPEYSYMILNTLIKSFIIIKWDDAPCGYLTKGKFIGAWAQLWLRWINVVFCTVAAFSVFLLVASSKDHKIAKKLRIISFNILFSNSKNCFRIFIPDKFSSFYNLDSNVFTPWFDAEISGIFIYDLIHQFQLFLSFEVARA